MTQTTDSVQHEETERGGRFLIGSAARPDAEMTYSRSNPHLIIIDHTAVDPSRRGQGLGQILLAELVTWVRIAGIKVIPICPFAKAQFEKTPDIQDVLAG